MNYGTLPFLISGPPGTGKTKTIVEIALQLYTLAPETSHILICAPSDSAADTIADRLRQIIEQTKQQCPALFRLNAPSRTHAEVPAALLPYCYVASDMFWLPDFEELMSINIVVTSCRDAAMLCKARVTNYDLFHLEDRFISELHSSRPPIPLHWSALLIDEAAQATEPIAAIPLSVVMPPPSTMKATVGSQPLFVMAGDQHQLGPRTFSHHPDLTRSLFSRLFSLPVYTSHPLSRSQISSTGTPVLKKSMLPILRPPFANLLRNYRSHPSILAVPSSIFYADTLIPEATQTDCLSHLRIWRGRQWPVLFDPNTGTDELEQEGGGWYDVGEADLAVQHALAIFSEGYSVEQREICVMSPFAAQVKLLREKFRYAKLWDVNIGPCEAFQGLESRVVILCTTRTRKRFLERDLEVCKGLVKQLQRMNVALTRAMHGLVILGNPELLREDKNWWAYLAFCERNGLVMARGGEIPQLAAMKDVLGTMRLERVLLRREFDVMHRKFDAIDLEEGRRLGGIFDEVDEMWNKRIAAEAEVDEEDVEEVE